MTSPEHPALTQALAARRRAPEDAVAALSLGRVLAQLGRGDEAERALRDAVRLKPNFAEARFDLAQHLHRTGKLDEAETIFRALTREMPGVVHMKIALGAVLIDQGLPGNAETILRRAVDETCDPALTAQIQLNLGTALRRQRKDAEALAAADAARTHATTSTMAELHRAEALENLGCTDEAVSAIGGLLARAPADPGLHHAYNDLLYRLGRDDAFLKSYDRAPTNRPLLLGKAYFLTQAGRHHDAHAVYKRLQAQDPHDPAAALGVCRTLVALNQAGAALAAYEPLLAQPGIDPTVFSQAAEAALLVGDARKAAQLCEQGLARMPLNGACLAMLGTAWRMMGDERDEILSGYDTLIRVIDLEAPDGFANMDDFNTELDRALDRLHPGRREFLGQSLRGGTQTPASLFDAGIPLVEKLKNRVDEAVSRYIADLPEEAAHPFLSRRARTTRYAGSWSSRLRDSGFHVNHIHPMGWISSCYYVAVPHAVEDKAARQGWITFGQPSAPVGLKQPVRRAIQPATGRLILFPSYLWHGTIPFQDSTARTTIAFDVVPHN